MEKVTVGIAEYKISRNSCVMETISLGSCIGIALYDRTSKIAGFAHIMLPNSSTASARHMNVVPGKYADTAITAMLGEMQKLGAAKNAIVAKIAGGACMFETSMQDPMLNIGDRNIEAVKALLAKENISIIAEDVGANYGRTVRFDTATGQLCIDSSKLGRKTI